MASVRSLVRELRSRTPCLQKKKKKEADIHRVLTAMVQFHNIGTMVHISVPLEDNSLRERKGYLLGILQLDPDDSNPLWEVLT